MKLRKFALSLLLLLACSSQLLAHALWIETSSEGAVGKAQEVKIFYGEFAAGELEPVEGWYSDVKEFTLWLIGPDKQKTELKYQAHDNYFTASFTPEEEGVYTLAIGHSAKDLGGTYVYQFNTSARVKVGKSAKGNELPPAENEMYVLLDGGNSYKVNGIVKGSVIYKGKPAADVEVIVASPEGWSKNFKTDAEGNFQFPVIWKGNYMLEATYTEDKKGEHFGKAYEHIWRNATTLTSIK